MKMPMRIFGNSRSSRTMSLIEAERPCLQTITGWCGAARCT